MKKDEGRNHRCSCHSNNAERLAEEICMYGGTTRFELWQYRKNRAEDTFPSSTDKPSEFAHRKALVL